MVDVAKRAKTTVATVSRVINNVGYVSDPLRKKVEKAIEQVGFVPNANARALRTNRSQTIGVVVGDLMNPYSIELASTVTREVAAHGYTTFIATAATDSSSSEMAVLDAFHRQRVDGMVVATVPTPKSDAAIRRLADSHIPIVAVGRKIRHKFVDCITADYRKAGELATAHLIKQNHKRIAFVGAELDDAKRVTRLRGYLDAMEAAGLPLRPEYVAGNPAATGSPRYATQATGYEATHHLLKLPTPPTAIFARNDQTALGVLQALSEAGKKAPDDVSLIGFDNIPLSKRIVPALTTVSQPTENQGQLASEFLLARIESDQVAPGRNLVLECALIERSSTAPPTVRRRAKRKDAARSANAG